MNDGRQPPVGPVVGGALGGLALLALLGALLWYYLQRKSKLQIKIGRGEKEVDKQREKVLEAEAAVLEREKFLDAARARAGPDIKYGDTYAGFGGPSSYPKNSTATPPQRWI